MGEYQHYIEVDDSGLIIDAFSSAFREPGPSSIAIEDDGGRHFNLSLTSMRGVPRYRYVDGKLIERGQAEIDAAEAPITRRGEILARLEEIDRKTVRPLRAGETARVAELDAEADALRTELGTL